MSTLNQSLNAVKAALQSAQARSEGSVARGRGEQPFVCATAGLRINDLTAVVDGVAQLEAELDAKHTKLVEVADKFRATEAELAAAEALNAAQLEEMSKAVEENSRLQKELASAYDCIDAMRKVPGVSHLLAKAVVDALKARGES